MKTLNIIMLCLLLLIQGIGQSYGSQMMSAKATTLAPEMSSMSHMPCHEVADNAPVTMNDCCDQDCQCHTLASAMLMSAFVFASTPSSPTLSYFKSSFFSYSLKSLYRPPIFA
jgi:hypothetical protein